MLIRTPTCHWVPSMYQLGAAGGEVVERAVSAVRQQSAKLITIFKTHLPPLVIATFPFAGNYLPIFNTCCNIHHTVGV